MSRCSRCFRGMEFFDQSLFSDDQHSSKIKGFGLEDTYNSPLAKILLAFSSETKCALTWKATLWISSLSPTKCRSVPTKRLSFINTCGGCFSMTRPRSTSAPRKLTYDDFMLGSGFWPSRIGIGCPKLLVIISKWRSSSGYLKLPSRWTSCRSDLQMISANRWYHCSNCSNDEYCGAPL